ncbi:MAG: hypothetical protein IKJ26_01060 [Clostridia bacterium]|nr:hypothetical protein [Clostridia bacterium]
MKDTCPGCSRHCPMNHLHCKYGEKYFAKQTSKWTALVTEDGLLWQLRSTSKSVKKALKRKETTEEALLACLSDEEKYRLMETLQKISVSLPEKQGKKKSSK